MENASKALIIAGAILLALLLISIGVYILNTTGSMQTSVEKQSQTVAIRTFNSNFIAYEGKTMPASQVKALMTLITSSNASNGHANKKITEVSNENRYVYLESGEGCITNPSEINARAVYDVEITGYSAGGYVNSIRVKGTSITSNPEIGTPAEPGTNVDPNVPNEEEIPANHPPVIINVIVSEITETSAKIKIEATDPDLPDDELTYEIRIGSSTFTGKTYIKKVTDLKPDTEYVFKAIVRDKCGETDERDCAFRTLKGNTAPEIQYAEVSDKTTTTAKIKTKATDIDGDKLTYELWITGKNGPIATKTDVEQDKELTFELTGLEEYTLYDYYIIAKDAELDDRLDNSFRTYCPGGITCSAGKHCIGPTNGTYPCGTCGGAGNKVCGGSLIYQSQSSTGVNYSCAAGCIGVGTVKQYRCQTCNQISSVYFCINGHPNGSTSTCTKTSYCYSCEGKGTYSYQIPCTHGSYIEHYYCDEHTIDIGSLHTHTTPCTHGKTSQHDE